MKKEAGNVGEFMAVCICILMMTMLLVSYMDSVQLIQAKSDVNQIARKYILRMESVGCLTEADRAALSHELSEMGVIEVSMEGTTFIRAGYGEEIVLQLRGKLEGNHAFEEKRVSTAKY